MPFFLSCHFALFSHFFTLKLLPASVSFSVIKAVVRTENKNITIELSGGENGINVW
jgi:hypothetical protein